MARSVPHLERLDRLDVPQEKAKIFFEMHNFIEYWLVPLLEDKRFNSEKTMVLLSFDESEIANAINKIFVLGLGNAIPQELVGTTDPTCALLYPTIANSHLN